WYYAYLAATILNDSRANFYRSQADMHGFAAAAAPVATPTAAAKPKFDLAVRLIKEGKETQNALLKEGEAFKLAAKVKNTGSAASGVRIKVSGLAAVRDAVGGEQYVGDLASGEERAVELSGNIGNVIQETGTIQVEAA